MQRVYANNKYFFIKISNFFWVNPFGKLKYAKVCNIYINKYTDISFESRYQKSSTEKAFNGKKITALLRISATTHFKELIINYWPYRKTNKTFQEQLTFNIQRNFK